MRVVCALAAVLMAFTAWAEVRMSVEQLRAFIESSHKLGHSDKQVADYLKNIKLTQRLEPGVVEDLHGTAGPRTLEALRKLSDSTKSLPAPPPPPPKPVVTPIPPPSSAEQGRILGQVREYALDYSKSLPNFICTQVTRRYVDPSGLEFWQQQDVITAKLSFFEQKEDYKVVLINNRYVDTNMDRLGGATSTGEFGSMMKEVFEPESRAEFGWERWATLRGRRAHVFAYRVPQETSKWSIVYEKTASTRPGYRGLIYVDRETLAVMRITLEAETLPLSFPVQSAQTILDYDFQKIAAGEFVLPLKAVMRMRAGKFLVKNEVEFRMYNRFGAEATITFTPDPLSEDQLKEQPSTGKQ
jgi:hypothetical protein